MKKVPPTEKIAIGLPRGADTRYNYEFMKSLFEMFGQSSCAYQLISASKVHHIARNSIIEDFLKTDKNYLLFIDSDMVWEPDSLNVAYDFIQKDEVDMVTGIYHQKNKPHLPVIKKLNIKAGCYNTYLNWKNEPFEVDGSGMGFVLIPRYVLEAMEKPYCDWKGGFAEDLYFFLQAKIKHEFSLWAHPGIKVGHVGRRTITRMDWEKQHKPSVQAWILENMKYTTHHLKEQYPNWREILGIHPLDLPNPNTKEYWNKVYEMEGGAKKTWRTYPEKTKIVLKEVMNLIEEKDQVLELGCGLGKFAQELIKEDVEYLGLDISDYAVKECQAQGIPARQADIPPIDLPDKTYDLVLGLEFLEHLDDEPRLEVLKEVKRVLKPGGHAIFSVPNNIMPPEEVLEHRTIFDQKSFGEFLMSEFELIENKPIKSRHTEKADHKVEYLLATVRKEKNANSTQEQSTNNE